MKRLFLVALAVTGALFGTAGAQAKGPPDGVDICGASGTCVHLSTQDAETNWPLWAPPSPDQTDRASAVRPFLVVHWHWPNQPETSAYYVPASGKVRQLDTNGFLAWYDLADATSVRTKTASLDPFPVPRVTRVTVGTRRVRDPESYLQLFGRGYEVFPAILPGWQPIRFTADTASPWTDAATDVRIASRGSLLWIDGTILKIPLQLAQRIRRGASLRG